MELLRACPYGVFTEQAVYHGLSGQVQRKGLRSKKMLSVRDHNSDRLGQESAIVMVMVMTSGGSSGLFKLRSNGKTSDLALG
jgi:hypothetical protein